MWSVRLTLAILPERDLYLSFKKAYWFTFAVAVAVLLAVVWRGPVPVPDIYAARPGQPLAGLTPHERDLFERGRALFAHEFSVDEGLGPLFNARSCQECHAGGAGSALEGKDVTASGDVYIGTIDPRSPRARDPETAREEDDIYDFSSLSGKGGPVLQRRSITSEFSSLFPPQCSLEAGGVPAEARFVCVRHAPPLLGMGLIDAIDEQTILANMIRQAKDAPDLVGRTNPVADPLTARTRVGRFGWKDQQANLLLFTAQSLNTELGVTTYIQSTSCSGRAGQVFPSCILPRLPPEPNDEGDKMLLLNAYLTLLAPPRTPHLPAGGGKGTELFKRLRCAVCHTPELETAPVVEMADPDSPLPKIRYIEVKALEGRPVKLYSDLLLHAMGPDLADGIVQGTARGGEWRTAPLWGLGRKKFFLHDGRARTIDAAILAHHGQSEPVTRSYMQLPGRDRAALLEFLGSL